MFSNREENDLSCVTHLKHTRGEGIYEAIKDSDSRKKMYTVLMQDPCPCVKWCIRGLPIQLEERNCFFKFLISFIFYFLRPLV